MKLKGRALLFVRLFFTAVIMVLAIYGCTLVSLVGNMILAGAGGGASWVRIATAIGYGVVVLFIFNTAFMFTLIMWKAELTRAIANKIKE